jgi:hypothetical protein
LRDEKRLERAILARAFDAGIERVNRDAEVIEEREADQREREIASALRQHAIELRAFDEAR